MNSAIRPLAVTLCLFWALLPAPAVRAIDLSGITVVEAEKQPHRKNATAGPEVTGRGVKFTQISAKANEITDDELWWGQIQAVNPLLKRRDGTNTGRLFHSEGEVFATEGDVLMLLEKPDNTKADWAMHFSDLGSANGGGVEIPVEIFWAARKDGVLYVSTFHRGYAKDSGGANGYISAHDSTTGKLLWRSPALVCNSQNFLLHGDFIICGYGFTAEPDFIYVLDRKTGKVGSRVKVKSSPEYFALKNDVLHVRCYDTNYQFKVTLPASTKKP